MQGLWCLIINLVLILCTFMFCLPDLAHCIHLGRIKAAVHFHTLSCRHHEKTCHTNFFFFKLNSWKKIQFFFLLLQHWHQSCWSEASYGWKWAGFSVPFPCSNFCVAWLLCAAGWHQLKTDYVHIFRVTYSSFWGMLERIWWNHKHRLQRLLSAPVTQPDCRG